MCGELGVTAELFLFAADVTGIYELNGNKGPWESGRIQSCSLPHLEIDYALRFIYGLGDRVILIHSTNCTEPGAAWPSAPGPQWSSWRPKDATIYHTYGALIRPSKEYVLDEWPDAEPITVALFDELDRPPSYEPTQMPVSRNGDVICHLLRTLNGLLQTDDDNAEAAGELWARHLAPFKPVFARMYHRKDDDAETVKITSGAI